MSTEGNHPPLQAVLTILFVDGIGGEVGYVVILDGVPDPDRAAADLASSM
jgi:hypothetical protein